MTGTGKFSKRFAEFWTTTLFATDEVSRYARRVVLGDTRRGLLLMSLTMLGALVGEAALFTYLGLGLPYLYTCTLLATLAVHIYISASAVKEISTLNALGMTLLVVSGTAFVLLAHQTGKVNIALFASVVLLFMVIPMMPWGLRESSLVVFLIYGLMTISTLSGSRNFDPDTLAALQFIMVSATLVSLVIVARNTRVRRDDIRARYELELAHARLLQLSNRDPLTGAWNRRYLNNQFQDAVARWQADGLTCHFAFIDLDDFKTINDRFGHEYGDLVLRQMTRAFMRVIGGNGYFVRLGGDEFAVLFSGRAPATVLEDGLTLCRELLAADAPEGAPPVSMSMGMFSFGPNEEVDQMMAYRIADEAVYTSKQRKGRYGSRLNLTRLGNSLTLRMEVEVSA